MSCTGLKLGDPLFIELLSNIFDELRDAIAHENAKLDNSAFPSYEYKANLVAKFFTNNITLPKHDRKQDMNFFKAVLGKVAEDINKIYKILINKTYLGL